MSGRTEFVGDPRPCLLPEAPDCLGVVPDSRELFRELGRVTGIDQQTAVAVADRFRKGTDTGDDDRDAVAHRLCGDQAECFGPQAGDDNDAGPPVKFGQLFR